MTNTLYTPEEKSTLSKDLQLLHRYKRNQEECEPFLKFSGHRCKGELLPDAESRHTNRTAIKAILKDLVAEGHPLLGKPKRSSEYWLMLGEEDIPEIAPIEGGPEHFEIFSEVIRRVLEKPKLTDHKIFTLLTEMEALGYKYHSDTSKLVH